MAFSEALWRNSVWSRDNYDIALRGLEELNTPWNRGGGKRRPARGPLSKFSADSEDSGDRHADCSCSHAAALSRFSPRLKRDTRGHNHELRSQMPRTYAGAQHPQRYTSTETCRSSVDEEKGCDSQSDPLIPGDETEPKVPTKSLLRETLFVTTVCVAHFCAQAGIGQTLPIMKSVASRFQVANANDLSASIGGYTMALGTFILIAGRLGDTFGHKPIFMMGLIWSAVWSLVAGASFYSTRPLFIASRAFQGLGAALTLPTGLALLIAMRATGTRKIVIFTLYATMSPTGLVAGALGASILDRLTWWPWVYWVLSITLVVLRTISRFIIPSATPARRRESGARAVTLQLDIPGMLTSVTSLGVFAFVWSEAQVEGWEHAYIWIMLTISAALAVSFLMIETWYAPNPLIPYQAFSLKALWVLVALGCGSACFGIWLFYGWQFVQRFRSTSPLLVTAYFIPLLLVGCFAAATTRLILRRFGPHGVFCVAMLAIKSAGVLLATLPIRQAYWQELFTSILFMSWGVYTSIPVAILIVSRMINNGPCEIASRLVWAATYCGMGLGIAFAGTAEHAAMSGRLTVQNRLRGHTAACWTGAGLAGLGLVVCLALMFVSRSRGRKRYPHCPCRDCNCAVYA